MRRYSYWPYKEPLQELIAMEKGSGTDQDGNRMSKHVFAGQYMQSPKAIGGNIIKGASLRRYSVLPKILRRKIFADTAQKTRERNDYSVFEEWGLGEDGRIYLLDMIRGKWESPELKRRCIEFWSKCKNRDVTKYGQLLQLMVEDKSSGTGLIQEIKASPQHQIPVKGIERHIDKVVRVNDITTWLDDGFVCIPESAPFTSDFVNECEAFTADDSHAFDDQIDPMVDAIVDMLSTGNKIKTWERLI